MERFNITVIGSRIFFCRLIVEFQRVGFKNTTETYLISGLNLCQLFKLGFGIISTYWPRLYNFWVVVFGGDTIY